MIHHHALNMAEIQNRMHVRAQASAHAAAEVIARALPDPFWWRHRKPMAMYGRVGRKALAWVIKRRRKARRKLERINRARAAGEVAVKVGAAAGVHACCGYIVQVRDVCWLGRVHGRAWW